MWIEIIVALIGLLGVLIGAEISIHSQKIQRRQARYREQLDQFYSPMFAWRSFIDAKGRTRIKINEAADSTWRDLVARSRPNIEQMYELTEERGPEFQRIEDETNRIFKEEIFPQYQKMVQHFIDHYSLAEPSTQTHLITLVEFVEIWERWLQETIPWDVMRNINNNEEKLLPFYEDLQTQLNRLQCKLVK